MQKLRGSAQDGARKNDALRKYYPLKTGKRRSVNIGDFEQANEHHHLNMIKHRNKCANV